MKLKRYVSTILALAMAVSSVNVVFADTAEDSKIEIAQDEVASGSAVEDIVTVPQTTADEVMNIEENIVNHSSKSSTDISIIVGRGNFYFDKSTGTITDCDINVSGEVRIPNSIRGVPVTSIGNNAFENCIGVSDVIIPDTVTNIGDYAFENCTALKNIEIPNSITHIGEGAFIDCIQLNTVNLPEFITNIEDALFLRCYDLNDIDIPNNVINIGKQAFTNTSLENIVIPEKVKSIGDYAFQTSGYGDTIKSITIPNSLENIGDGAFGYCENIKSLTTGQVGLDCGWSYRASLENIELLNGVTVICDSAFESCGSLTRINIPDNVTSIGDSAFSGCNGLTDITIPNSVTSIGNRAFSGCNGLTDIAIPNSVVSIGDGAFCGCDRLTSITIPNGVMSIGNSVFSGCDGLTDIAIPNSVTNIGNYAFYSCDSLTKITIPNSVTSIGYNAFYSCDSLTDITIPNSVTIIGNDAFIYCNNIKYLKTGQVGLDYGWSSHKFLEKVELLNGVTNIGNSVFSGCNGLTDITIPNSVVSIGNSAFSGCNGLRDIAIPNSVTSIGNSAFSGCNGLTDIAIPNSVVSIGDGAFCDCDRLTSITIPNGVMSIGDSVFSGCDGLTDITIPNSVTSIGNRAFSGCNGLTDIAIPNSVVSIGDGVFCDCDRLTSITIPNGVMSIGNSVFSGCDGLTDIAIPNSVTNIGNYAFYSCDSLTKITIPNSVTSIGYNAFNGCSGLTDITIPNSVTIIGNDAFIYCNNIKYLKTGQVGLDYGWSSHKFLEKVELLNGVTNIGNSVFSGCNGLTDIAIPNSVTNIGNYAFYSCNSLTKITVPNSVASIGDSAFFGCDSLTSITIPNGVMSIGNRAFSGCNGLREITIPNSVTSIGDYAFTGCNNIIYLRTGQAGVNYGWRNESSLKEIELTDTVTNIPSSAFSGCTGLTSVTIPSSVTDISSKAFYNCSGLTEIMIPDSVTTISGDAFEGCNNLTIYCPSDSYSETYAKDNNIPYSTSGYVDYTLTEADIPADVGDGIRFKQKIYEYGKDYFIVGDPPFTGNLRTMFKDESLVDQVTYTVTDKNVLDIVSKSNVGYVISLVDRMGYDYESNAKATLFKNGECIVTATLPNGDSSSCLVRVKCYDTGYDVNNDFTKPNFTTSVTCENNLSYSDGSFSKNSIPLTINYGNISRIDHTYTDEETNQCTVKNLSIDISLPSGLSFSSDRIDDKYKTILIGDVNVGGGDTVTLDVYPTSYVAKQLKIDVDFEADNVNVENVATILVQSDEILNYNVPSSTQEYLNTLSNESQIAFLLDEYYNSISRYENAVNTMLNKKKQNNQSLADSESIYQNMKDYVNQQLEIVYYLGLDDEEKEAINRALYLFIKENTEEKIDCGEIDINANDVMIGAGMVKKIRNSIKNEELEYKVDFKNSKGKEVSYNVRFKVFGIFGAFKCDDIKLTNRRTGEEINAYPTAFTSSTEKVALIMTKYVNNLKDIGVDVTNQGIISAVDFYADTLGINKYIKDSISKKLKDVAPILKNKGLGQIVSFAEGVADDYKLLKKIDVNDFSSSKSTINSLLSNEIKTETIEDEATQSVYDSFINARDNLIRAFTAYVYGTETPTNTVAKSQKTFNVKCPVNIIVYDSTGNEIGSVIDDVIECNSDIISISKNGDLKSINLLKNEAISFKIVATDYGNLNISVEDYNDENGAVGRTNYYNIPLTMDKEFTTNTTSDGDLVLYSDGNSYIYNEKLTANADCGVTVDVITENGKVIGSGTYVKGDYVALTAIPDDDYKFVGWYQGDTYLSNSVLYEFAVSSNITLTAKFTEEVSTTDEVINGDITGDDVVNRSDLLRLNKYFSGMDVEISNADVNGDGVVNRSDLLRLNKYFASQDIMLD